MTIKEIMTSNKPYISKYGKMDETLKTKAKNLLWEFNNSRPDDNKRRSEILQELLGTCSKLTFIEPVFKCDYGFNIHTAAHEYIHSEYRIITVKVMYLRRVTHRLEYGIRCVFREEDLGLWQ